MRDDDDDDVCSYMHAFKQDINVYIYNSMNSIYAGGKEKKYKNNFLE